MAVFLLPSNTFAYKCRGLNLASQSIGCSPIHDMVMKHGLDTSSGMLFFNAFTDCDVPVVLWQSKKNTQNNCMVSMGGFSRYLPVLEKADFNTGLGEAGQTDR